MKPFFFLWFILIEFFSFLFAQPSSAATQNILLSEIQIAGDKTDDEFIELYNQSNVPIDLYGFQLRRKTQGGSASSIKVFEKNSIILGHGFYLWGNSKGIFALPVSDAETSSSALSDNNSVALYTKSGIEGELVDTLTWGTGAPFSETAPVFPNPGKNKSFIRNTSDLGWSLSSSPTPTGSKDSPQEEPPEEDPPTPAPTPHIRFNEILPNPGDKGEKGEFIELYNPDDTEVFLEGFTLKDASISGHYTFPKENVIAARGFFVITKDVFKFALNNSDESLVFLDSAGKEIDRVSYKATKEDVSLNYLDGKWRGSRFLTPGAKNIFNSLPEIREKVPKQGYKGVPIDFDAHGKDADGDTLKYVWNFGDGHKSYKAKTTHKFEENGTYTVILTTTDGSENAVETFPLKINSYPKVKVRIVSFVPNPHGRDSENEWLLLENRGKKSVNLKGFSIASGWKNLINHPIREDFVLEPKQKTKLTRSFSLFTLPNQKGKVELRAPNGNVLQKIKYKLDQSAKEDIVYSKEKGKRWEWQENEVEESEDEISDSSSLDALSENSQAENTETPNNITEFEKTKEVLGESIIAPYPERKTYPKLLNYGTRIVLPKNITLTFTDDFQSDPDLILTDEVNENSNETAIQKINQYLNTWQNEE